MQEIHKDDGANACWIGFKQTAEKGRNWTNKRETRAALSARWHLPSTITLTLAEAFAESTSSNDLLKVQAANALPGFLASPRQSETFLKKFTARHTIAAGFSRRPVVAKYEHFAVDGEGGQWKKKKKSCSYEKPEKVSRGHIKPFLPWKRN